MVKITLPVYLLVFPTPSLSHTEKIHRVIRELKETKSGYFLSDKK